MKLWRRFVLWLARGELDAIRHEVYRLGVDQGLTLELSKRTAYAEGQLAGRQEMLDHIDSIVAARTNGAGDLVMPEDLARAKRGLLH